MTSSQLGGWLVFERHVTMGRKNMDVFGMAAMPFLSSSVIVFITIVLPIFNLTFLIRFKCNDYSLLCVRAFPVLNITHDPNVQKHNVQNLEHYDLCSISS